MRILKDVPGRAIPLILNVSSQWTTVILWKILLQAELQGILFYKLFAAKGFKWIILPL